MDGTTTARSWPRVKWTRAGQVAALAGDNVQLEDMLELPPSEAFARMRARDAVEATHFIAHCLPRLQALQWLSQCLATMTPTTLARRLAARKAVNRWLADPSDANRRLAFEAGDNAGFDTPEGCACLTLFLSGGSLAPATQEQPVLPPPAAFGQLLASAVLLATLNDDPPNHARRLATALADAEQLAATAEGRA